MERISDGLEARIDNATSRLFPAILGGAPVRLRQWPKWPRAAASTQRNLLDVLHSTKWALSGQSENLTSYEQRFAQAFAEYCGTQYCVPCGSGTAALTIALQALCIGLGDEVIVPGLTWVACASAVCHTGGIPVLVDVDPLTLCLSPKSIEAAITTRTRAIMMVHLYSSIASIGEILKLAARRDLAVIEDASQAHGATYNGRKVGTFGAIAAFSMQQSKLLTCGEGGACLTDDETLYRRMQQFRADGRIYARAGVYDPYREIVPCGEVLGRNLCLSEFHAAILLDRLTLLDIENEHRRRQLEQLEIMLDKVAGVTLIPRGVAEGSTCYKICLRFDESWLQDISIEVLARALTEELSLPVEPIDAPLNANMLYQPLRSPYIGRLLNAEVLYDPRQYDLPVAATAAQCCLSIPHWSLLGDASDLADIIAALTKLWSHKGALSAVDAMRLRATPYPRGPLE